MLIKIKEDEQIPSKVSSKIHVILENNEEKTFEGYPITLKPIDIKPLTFELQKSSKLKGK
jgi:hypothetical protein